METMFYGLCRYGMYLQGKNIRSFMGGGGEKGGGGGGGMRLRKSDDDDEGEEGRKEGSGDGPVHRSRLQTDRRAAWRADSVFQTAAVITVRVSGLCVNHTHGRQKVPRLLQTSF